MGGSNIMDGTEPTVRCPTCNGPYKSWWYQPSSFPGFRPDMCKTCFFTYIEEQKAHPSYYLRRFYSEEDCRSVEGPRSNCPSCGAGNQYTARIHGNLRRACCGSVVVE